MIPSAKPRFCKGEKYLAAASNQTTLLVIINERIYQASYNAAKPHGRDLK